MGDSLFCARCGTLMQTSSATQGAQCRQCGAVRSLEELSQEEILYVGKPEVFLQRFGIEQKLPNGERVSSLQTDSKRERATVDEKCVSCGHRGLSFYTMQLRSADEGQTVFFECPKCKHKWSVNT